MAATLTQRIQLEGGDKIRAELDKIGKAAGEALQKLRAGSKEAVQPQQELNRELENTSKAIDGVRASSDGAGESLIGFKTKIALLAAAAVGAVAAFVALAKGAADTAVETKNAADRIGVSIKTIRELRGIGEVFGVSAGAVESTFGRVTRILQEAGDLSKKTVNGFTEVQKGWFAVGSEVERTAVKVGQFYKIEKAGREQWVQATEQNRVEIAFKLLQKQVDGTASSLSEADRFLNNFVGGLAKFKDRPLDLFEKVAQQLEAIPDPAKRAFYVQKAGLEEIGPLILNGVEAYKKYRKALEDIGAFRPFTADQQKAARDFDALFTTIQLAIKNNRDRTRIAFVEALVDPLEAVLGLMRAKGGEVDGFLSVLAKNAGKFVADIIRAFTPTGINPAGGLVFGLDVEKIDEANKGLLTFRDTVVSFGRQVYDAIRNIVVPAWTALVGVVIAATRAANDFFGTNFGDAELAIGGVLLKITGLFKLLGAAVVVATGTLGKFAIAAGLAAAALAAETPQALEKAVTRIRDFFTGAFNEITSGGNKTEAALSKVASSIKRIEFPSQKMPIGDDAGGGNIGAGLQAAPKDEDTARWRQFLDIINQVRDAVINAYTNVKRLFTEGEKAGGAFGKVLQLLLAAFNKLLGTEFTAGGLAVVAIFLQLAGLLAPLIVILAAFSTLFFNVAKLFFVVAGAGLKLVTMFFNLRGAALAASAAFAAFGKIGTAAITGLLGVVRALLGWPGLLIAGLGLVYAYWDQVKEYASRAWEAIKGFVSTLWDGFLARAGEVWSGVKTVAETTWAAIVTVATAAWTAITTVATAAWTALTTVAQGFWAGLTTIATVFWSGVRTVGTETWAALKTVASDIWSGTLGQAASYWESVKSFGVSAWDSIKNAVSGLSGILSRVFGFGGSDAAAVQEQLVSPFRGAVDAIRQLMSVDLPAAFQAGANSIVSIMDSLASSVAQSLARIQEALARARAAAAEASSLGGGGGGGGEPFASGGYVRGAGSGTSDSIPAWLSNGEFVIRAAAVRQYGLSFLRAVNGMRLNPQQFKLGMPRFAMGGAVDMSRLAPVPIPAVAGGGGTLPGASFNLIIGDQMFANLYAPQDTAANLQRYAAAAKTRSAGRKPGWYR